MSFQTILEELMLEYGKPDPMKVAAKRKSNERDDFKKPGKYKIGDRVIGKRSGDGKHEKEPGELVKQDVTVNDGFRNPSYHIKCDSDGKVRKFQGIVKEEAE